MRRSRHPEGRALAVESVLRLSGGVLDGVVACAGVSGPTPLTVRVNFFGVTALLVPSDGHLLFFTDPDDYDSEGAVMYVPAGTPAT